MMDSNTDLSSINKLSIDDANNSNDRYNTYLREVKEVNLSNFAPPSDLRHTESPYRWVQFLKSENMSSGDYLIKMEDYSNQGDSYTFEKSIPFLALAFEYSLLRNFEKSKYFINKMRDLLHSMANENGTIYRRMKTALEHVFIATAANVFILADNDSAEAQNLKIQCSNLEPLSAMDSVQQAAVHAIKSKFYLSCTLETELALTHMMEAARLDPNCATWKYWTGKILRKIRRDNKGFDPSGEELRYFEEAVNEDRDAKHLVFLAQAYRERASYLQRKSHLLSGTEKKESWKKVALLNERASELYMESIKLNPSSAAICRRAGNGLMSLPEQYANYTLAKQLLHTAEQCSINPITFFTLGTFYNRYGQNPEKALEYFQKSVDNYMVRGYTEIIRIKYISYPNYDPLEDLEKAEKALMLSRKVRVIESDIGWYYLVFKNNLQKGLEYFWKVIERDEHSALIKRFSSYTFLVKVPLNMYKILQEHILKTDEELRDELMIRFLDKVNRNPRLLDDGEKCVSLNKALRETSSSLKWERSKENNRKLSQDNKGKNGNQEKSNQYPATTILRKESGPKNVKPGCTNNGGKTSGFRARPKQENQANYNSGTRSWRNTSIGDNSSATDKERK